MIGFINTLLQITPASDHDDLLQINLYYSTSKILQFIGINEEDFIFSSSSFFKENAEKLSITRLYFFGLMGSFF